MNAFRAFACFFVVASLASGCSESSLSPTSPTSSGGSSAITAGQLSGTWRLVSLQATGGAEQAAPGSAVYTLTFGDGRLSTRADCNMCGGGFTLSGMTLTAGPALACTRAACPTMPFENGYTSLLSGDSTVTLTGDGLTLSSDRGVLRFVR